MSRAASLGGDHWGLKGPRACDLREGGVAFAAVVALHAAVGGVLLLAGLDAPVTPPETILEVAFVTASAPAEAPAPPQAAAPPPPPPERTVMATSRPTESAMTAPPVEAAPLSPAIAQASAPAPPSPAPAAPSAEAAPAAAPGPAAPPAVTPPSFTAAYLNNPLVYPMASRRRREQGTVRLRVQVSAEGAPVQVLLERTSGFEDLDAAALDIVKKRWRFAPAKQDGRAVVAWVIVPVEYSLKDR